MPGKVVLSRSRDAEGQTTTVVGDAAEQSERQAIAAPTATDPVATNADRQAIRFTAYEMDVHLDAARRHIAVRALVAVQNDGSAPLSHIPLQISSSLTWDRIL